jgi:hypothetical protein
VKHLAVKNNIFHADSQFKHIPFHMLRLFNRGSEIELRYRSVISGSKELEHTIWSYEYLIPSPTRPAIDSDVF